MDLITDGLYRHRPLTEVKREEVGTSEIFPGIMVVQKKIQLNSKKYVSARRVIRTIQSLISCQILCLHEITMFC